MAGMAWRGDTDFHSKVKYGLRFSQCVIIRFPSRSPPITSPRLLPAPDDQAAGFVRQRDRARQAIAQDYVELIADLMREEGEARPVDLARRLGVSQATVTATVARLQRDGLVQTKPYRAIFLTEEGQAMADESAARHQ